MGENAPDAPEPKAPPRFWFVICGFVGAIGAAIVASLHSSLSDRLLHIIFFAAIGCLLGWLVQSKKTLPNSPMQFRLRTLLIVLSLGQMALILAGWHAMLNWSRLPSPTDTVPAHHYQSRRLLHAQVLANMPMNNELRCMGISLVLEALLDGEVSDADDCDIDDIGQQIFSNANTKQTIRFQGLVCWDGTKEPVQSRKALERLSDVVADLYKRMHDKMAATESGRRKLESAMAPIVADVADLDTLIDADSDNLLAFCAIGVREFPDGTSKDAYHVVLVGRDESGKKVIYDSNDPGRPIPCVLTADSDGLRVVWICRFRHTEQFTTQECRLVPTEAFFRVALARE